MRNTFLHRCAKLRVSMGNDMHLQIRIMLIIVHLFSIVFDMLCSCLQVKASNILLEIQIIEILKDGGLTHRYKLFFI